MPLVQIDTFLPVPPWKKGAKRIESSVRKALFDYKMLENRSKLAIALSGGKDSLTLLFMLKAIVGRGFPQVDLFAVHVSGAFSCGASHTTPYLKGLCDKLEVPLIVRHVEQKLEELECYSCSRIRRRAIFEAAKEAGVDTVAFGHHRDDNAQTLLLNMLQKGEFAGMLPVLEMVDFGITIIRPLIYLAEKEIVQFSKEYGFNKVTCRCPVGVNSMRKRVDHFLSEMEEYFPYARLNISRSGLIYGSDKATKRKS